MRRRRSSRSESGMVTRTGRMVGASPADGLTTALMASLLSEAGRVAASRELGHHLGHQALHLLGLLEDWIEQNQLRPGLRHLAQTSHAGGGWPVDRKCLQV